MTGQRIGAGGDLLRRPFGDDLAAVHAGAGADIDNIIGRPDRILVMLDHDHRIAEAAQAPERIEEPRIVALMQADRRLVQHVEDAGEARADLRGEADALALAARQRARRARQRQVVEPDVAQEHQPVDDLLEDASGDLVALGVEFRGQIPRPVDRRLHRQEAHFADVLAVDLDRERLGLEAEAVAGLAGRRAHIALDLLARPLAFRLLVAALEIGDHALERLPHLVGAQAVVVGEADLLVARAIEDGVATRLRQFAPGPVEAKLIVLAQRLQRLQIIGRTRLRPGRDRAALEALLRVGHDERGIDRQMRAQAPADRAGAVRIVEREEPRLDLGDGEAGYGTGEFGGEEDALG